MTKIKTYNLLLSKQFPVTHPKAGQPTGFGPKVMAAINGLPCYHKKLHTIRENYELWRERIEQVLEGKAEICLRQWSGLPYRSKTVELKRIGWQDGVGIQKLNFGWHNGKQIPVIEGWYMYGNHGSKQELANNDGLSLEDWQAWFKTHEKDTVYDKPLAIIFFTNFRY